MILSQNKHHVQHLTLIHCCCSKRHSSSFPLLLTTPLIIIFCITVLTTVCASAQAKVLSRPKTCMTSPDCGDPHKRCVNGECQCKPFFDYVPELGMCLKSYGSSCTTFEHSHEELCNVHKYLSCDDTQTCSCHIEGDSYLIYDSFLKTCAAPPGHQCELVAFADVKKDCVVNASCVPDPNRKVDKEFLGICKCDEGYVGKGEKCVPEEGSDCELDSDCDLDGMVCMKGECRCAEDRVYMKKGHDCKVKVGKGCEVAKRDCVDFAECQSYRNSVDYQWYSKCECQLGYQEIPENGTCKQDWHDNCRNGLIYDAFRQRCSLKVGMKCKPAEDNLCVTHAFCGTGDKCQCFEGYRAWENGTCQRKPVVVSVPTQPEFNSRKVTNSVTIHVPPGTKEDKDERGDESGHISINKFTAFQVFSNYWVLVTLIALINVSIFAYIYYFRVAVNRHRNQQRIPSSENYYE